MLILYLTKKSNNVKVFIISNLNSNFKFSFSLVNNNYLLRNCFEINDTLI